MNTATELPVYRCPLIAADFTPDGDLRKPLWQSLRPHWLTITTPTRNDPFRQLSEADRLALLTDTPPALPLAWQPTAFRACWSEQRLYLAFHCVDRDIQGTYLQRDDPLYEEEVVEAFLCPTGDLRHYYELEVSPRNVVFDARVFSPDLNRATMQVDTVWDCAGLLTAVKRNLPRSWGEADRWWSVEMSIPFAAFSEIAPPQPGSSWRVNFYRIDRADPPEFTAWSPTLEVPANFHVPQRFGRLLFVESAD
jgi:hypothetical protein